jgi:hypothetical protein
MNGNLQLPSQWLEPKRAGYCRARLGKLCHLPNGLALSGASSALTAGNFPSRGRALMQSQVTMRGFYNARLL